MTNGAGSLFLAAHDHRIGPGHFGRVLDYDASPDGSEGGPERFSIHYEADMARAGRSVLDIRPLLWSTDGWPVAGDNLTSGVYQILSRQTENTLEEHTPTAPSPAATAGSAPATPAVAMAPAPLGPPMLRVARYLALDNQKWTIAPAGGGFYKVVDAGTGDAIEVAGAGTVALAPYNGTDGQMWRLDEFTDGGYRIQNKQTGQDLMATGASGVATGAFVRDDQDLWTITTP
jgi:arabinan endo-1,5-alpha-L-arabinosidase